jgi:hypothetical protein
MSTFKKTLTLKTFFLLSFNQLSHLRRPDHLTERSPHKNKILSNKVSTQTRLACIPTKISDIHKGISYNSSDLKKAVLI